MPGNALHIEKAAKLQIRKSTLLKQLIALVVALIGFVSNLAASSTEWVDAMLHERGQLDGQASALDRAARAADAWQRLDAHYSVECDWVRQAGEPVAFLLSATNRAGLEEFARRCEERRAQRLAVLSQTPAFVFTKRRTIRPSFFAYTEAQSDAQQERHFLPGSELCLMEMKGARAVVRTLLADSAGVIRDPAVSWDGKHVMFAWKKALNTDDFHLYEMELASGQIRQITSGLGFADYEPAYLPNGDVVFASTRCVQTTDCFWTEVSNLYTCDREGRYLRRLGFDQVHTVYPQVLEDGRVIYTRWDYNDRGQVFPQSLFQMNADGTGQSEFYGNNSWFPTTIAHARGIPGTQKVLAIFCGHHTSQAGKLGVIDPAKGRQENLGAELIAPRRYTPAERIDDYGQRGELFQYPYPVSESSFVVGYAPNGWERGGTFRHDARFALYWMNVDGERELLVSDPRLPCSQPVPIASRPRPADRPSQVDYTRTNGTIYMQDIYAGMGLKGVSRGTIKRLRVVALEYRAAGVGENHSNGPGGGALSSTPVSIGNGTWDVKIVLGDATVRDDGSAYFSVPARTPVYFQALDENARAVQTMRSWTTLQPGETQSCIGCHDDKNASPAAPSRRKTTVALQSGVETLAPFYGAARGFSFRCEVQPILDRHCVRCHDDRSESAALLTREPQDRTAKRAQGTNEQSFSLLSAETIDPMAKRKWSDSYLFLTQSRLDGEPEGPWRGFCTGDMVNWIGSQSIPSALPPDFAGARRSALLPLLEQGHKDVKLSREELDKLAAWIDLLVPYCGDYIEANAWTPEELAKYERYAAKRRRMEAEEAENISALLKERAASATKSHVSQHHP